VSGNNLNNATDSGWYGFSPGATNAPATLTDYGVLFVIDIGGGNIRQVAYHYNGDAVWERRSSGGFGQWQAWFQTYPTTEASLPQRLRVQSVYGIDLNTVGNGWAAFDPSTPNAPASAYGYVFTIGLSIGDNRRQFAWQYNIPKAARHFGMWHWSRQQYDGGAWEAWQATDTGWLSLGKQAGWTDYGGGSTVYGIARYRKVNGIVYVQGLIAAPSDTALGVSIAGPLPVGYRPSQDLLCLVETATGPARIDIRAADGNITPSSPGAPAGWSGWCSINFPPFLADQ